MKNYIENCCKGIVEINVPKTHCFGVDQSNANANEKDVILGKTFYAGNNKFLKTGTFDPDVEANQISNYANLILLGGNEIPEDEGNINQLEIINLQKIILGELYYE